MKKKVDKACLYVGAIPKPKFKGIGLELMTLLRGYYRHLLLPFANQSIEILGRAGTGKTVMLNSILASGIQQRLPMVIYCYKGGKNGEDGQFPFLIPYALRHRYSRIKIWGPGKEYGNFFGANLLHRIRDERDRTSAMALGKLFHKNLKQTYGQSDGFFDSAGETLLASAFLLAKSTPYPDLGMAFAILSLPQLTERLVYAVKQKPAEFGFWQQVGFKQLMSVVDAERTKGGIIATAQDIANRFILEDLLPYILEEEGGGVDLEDSLRLQPGELLVFVSDLERKDVLNPLIAAYMSTLVAVNFAQPGSTPKVFCFDEAHSMGYVDGFPTWPNEHRSKGMIDIVAYHNFAQMDQIYGREGRRQLRTSLNTRFLFNPGDVDSAAEISRYLGTEEVILANKSVSNKAFNWLSQTTITEQFREVPLAKAEELVMQGLANCKFVSSAYGWGNKVGIPLNIKQIQISKQEIKEQQFNERLWYQEILPQLQAQNQQKMSDLTKAMQTREEYAQTMFPEPPESDSDSGKKSQGKYEKALEIG